LHIDPERPGTFLYTTSKLNGTLTTPDSLSYTITMTVRRQSVEVELLPCHGRSTQDSDSVASDLLPRCTECYHLRHVMADDRAAVCDWKSSKEQTCGLRTISARIP
jgi:hypothetical protein